jgi:ABC-2 type transport system ATP-binding protein
MTGREFVTTLGSLALLRGETLRKRVEDAICLVGMEANAGRKIGGYSKGMRQRIKLAQAMIHDPDVLLLDEPLNGLDPVGRREMSGLMHRWGEAGKCVVVSSHVLHEVEQMTHSILLIHHGRLLAQGDVYQIRALIDEHPHRISLTTSSARALARELLAMPGVVSVRLDGRDDRRLEVETRDPDGFYAQLPEIVLAGDFDVSGFESPDNNLEAVFRYLTQG